MCIKQGDIMLFSIDRSKCTKCGKCCKVAPRIFKISQNGIILVERVKEKDVDYAMNALNQCPESAINADGIGRSEKRDVWECINIASGLYQACFYNQEEYDKYFKIHNWLLVCYTLTAISVVLPIILLICKSFLFFIVGILAIILDCILVPIEINLTKNYNRIKYDSIKRALVKKGYRIVYENHTTGTISYMIGKQRHSVSIYTGYNSKWQSRYE